MTRRTRVWLIAAIAFLVVAVLVWFIAAWLGLKDANVWVLRIGLWVLALVASGLVAWFVAPPARRRETDAAEGDDLDTVLKAAESRLAAAKGAKRRLGTMPVIVVLGPAGSTKTTIVAHSGSRRTCSPVKSSSRISRSGRRPLRTSGSLTTRHSSKRAASSPRTGSTGSTSCGGCGREDSRPCSPAARRPREPRSCA